MCCTSLIPSYRFSIDNTLVCDSCYRDTLPKEVDNIFPSLKTETGIGVPARLCSEMRNFQGEKQETET